MISRIKVNLPEFILRSMLEPSKQLAFLCLLTEVFEYYNIGLSNETPSLGKQEIDTVTINMMFQLMDVVKILDGETVMEEDARLKKFYHGKIPARKRKRVDEEDKEVYSSSESKKGSKIIGLKKKFDYLKNKV